MGGWGMGSGTPISAAVLLGGHLGDLDADDAGLGDAFLAGEGAVDCGLDSGEG
mgnify:CR=1 FL=1